MWAFMSHLQLSDPQQLEEKSFDLLGLLYFFKRKRIGCRHKVASPTARGTPVMEDTGVGRTQHKSKPFKPCCHCLGTNTVTFL